MNASITTAAAVGGVARLVLGSLGGAVGEDSSGHAEVSAPLTYKMRVAMVAAAVAATDEEHGATSLAQAVANRHPTPYGCSLGGAQPTAAGEAKALPLPSRYRNMLVRRVESGGADLDNRIDEAADGPLGCNCGETVGEDEKDRPATRLHAFYRGLLDHADSRTVVAMEAVFLSPGRVRCFVTLLTEHAIYARDRYGAGYKWAGRAPRGVPLRPVTPVLAPANNSVTRKFRRQHPRERVEGGNGRGRARMGAKGGKWEDGGKGGPGKDGGNVEKCRLEVVRCLRGANVGAGQGGSDEPLRCSNRSVGQCPADSCSSISVGDSLTPGVTS